MSDTKRQILEMMKKLNTEQLAELNEAIRDALISAARGEPSRFPINEMADVAQDEARRICKKIGLDWESGVMRDPRDSDS